MPGPQAGGMASGWATPPSAELATFGVDGQGVAAGGDTGMGIDEKVSDEPVSGSPGSAGAPFPARLSRA
ncbi:MAG TPA: hypothetical protein VE196_04965, partial [Pseudonocardiaceae bacterium]|nr:hypothetical protein [Pseudonocardiaceae bacterium]